MPRYHNGVWFFSIGNVPSRICADCKDNLKVSPWGRIEMEKDGVVMVCKCNGPFRYQMYKIGNSREEPYSTSVTKVSVIFYFEEVEISTFPRCDVIVLPHTHCRTQTVALYSSTDSKNFPWSSRSYGEKCYKQISTIGARGWSQELSTVFPLGFPLFHFSPSNTPYVALNGSAALDACFDSKQDSSFYFRYDHKWKGYIVRFGVRGNPAVLHMSEDMYLILLSQLPVELARIIMYLLFFDYSTTIVAYGCDPWEMKTNAKRLKGKENIRW